MRLSQYLLPVLLHSRKWGVPVRKLDLRGQGKHSQTTTLAPHRRCGTNTMRGSWSRLAADLPMSTLEVVGCAGWGRSFGPTSSAPVPAGTLTKSGRTNASVCSVPWSNTLPGVRLWPRHAPRRSVKSAGNGNGQQEARQRRPARRSAVEPIHQRSRDVWMER